MKKAAAAIAEEVLEKKLKCLLPKKQLAVKQSFETARRKNTRGITCGREWILECILLKMRSPKLYEYIRRQNILTLPGRIPLRKYMSSYMGSFGFHMRMLDTLKKKTAEMDPFRCHGVLIIDEMKLTEHLPVDTAGKVAGFVDIGPSTPQEQKNVVADHGLVVMLVPLVGNWTQVLGTFATHPNVSGDLLAKIVLEATILGEKAGLFIDYITCDAAGWNRKMWRIRGVRANSKEIVAKRLHPVDSKRCIHFLWDPVKNIRNRLMETTLETPDATVSGFWHFVHARTIDVCTFAVW
ncbi:hypothetical protein HPB48_000974 [Haemaphysalis longicornis]|uniref:Transposable element P transposase-like RNase H domain-containing protein n=1 Tax=Haemaphysalis longicornis TaxID=44386 RepID=A0A9J6H5M8_HAELO|nr:hypothetical protein HPB48_000974 [Haemaphysalis longicornis]